ncbi:hypothetical protein ACH5RR_003157 [Cinchona calisaya]|uniref:Cytochrome c oxidase subunit 3 n=1 Tax=Cinchona calisaya TaxID=153742 RepID=A0ABD3AUC7_9GENT
MEYYQAPFTISDSIYGSTFFLATGFHGFHVIIGTLFLIICGIRQYLGHLTKEHHVGFEAAAWYLRDYGRSCSPRNDPKLDLGLFEIVPFNRNQRCFLVSRFFSEQIEEPNGSNSSLAATKDIGFAFQKERSVLFELKARAFVELISKRTILGLILAQLSCVRYVGNSSLERSGEPQPSKQAYKHEVKMNSCFISGQSGIGRRLRKGISQAVSSVLVTPRKLVPFLFYFMLRLLLGEMAVYFLQAMNEAYFQNEMIKKEIRSYQRLTFIHYHYANVKLRKRDVPKAACFQLNNMAPPLAEAKCLKSALKNVASLGLSVQQSTSSGREGYRTYKSLPVLTEALS